MHPDAHDLPYEPPSQDELDAEDALRLAEIEAYEANLARGDPLCREALDALLDYECETPHERRRVLDGHMETLAYRVYELSSFDRYDYEGAPVVSIGQMLDAIRAARTEAEIQVQ